MDIIYIHGGHMHTILLTAGPLTNILSTCVFLFSVLAFVCVLFALFDWNNAFLAKIMSAGKMSEPENHPLETTISKLI